MTVVIGSQTDVPATGDPIVSPWYQDTARKLVHQFTTVAARNAWTTRPEGAMAWTADENRLAVWTGAAWSYLAHETTGLFVETAGDTMTGDLTVGGSPTATAGTKMTALGQLQAAYGLDGGPSLYVRRAGSAGAGGPLEIGVDYVRFVYSASTIIGSIKLASPTSVVYNTTSDPRTKTAPSPRGVTDAAARAQELGRSAWRGYHIDPETGETTGQETDFLSSHDIADVAPYAVTGERDAVDDDGNPIYQQVAYGELVPLLFAALANALDRIDALENP